MRTLRRKLRVAHAWLMAASLVVAAAPHFRCVCPDGRVKPFCLAVPSGPTGCCCGGSCCPSNQGGRCCCQSHSDPGGDQGAESAPCCGQARPDGPSPCSHGQLRAMCCTKTPAGGEFLAVAPEQHACAEMPTGGPGAFLPAEVAVSTPSPFVARQLSWQSHQLPPPTDLVITLQHFLI